MVPQKQVHVLDPNTLDVSAYGVDWSTVQSALSDQSWATRLDLAALGGSAGDAVYLANVALADLTSDNFLTSDLIA